MSSRIRKLVFDADVFAVMSLLMFAIAIVVAAIVALWSEEEDFSAAFLSLAAAILFALWEISARIEVLTLQRDQPISEAPKSEC